MRALAAVRITTAHIRPAHSVFHFTYFMSTFLSSGFHVPTPPLLACLFQFETPLQSLFVPLLVPVLLFPFSHQGLPLAITFLLLNWSFKLKLQVWVGWGEGKRSPVPEALAVGPGLSERSRCLGTC